MGAMGIQLTPFAEKGFRGTSSLLSLINCWDIGSAAITLSSCRSRCGGPTAPAAGEVVAAEGVSDSSGRQARRRLARMPVSACSPAPPPANSSAR